MPTIALDTVCRPARSDADQVRHHFMCTRCGLVREVEDADLDAVRATTQVTRIGRPETVTFGFRGVRTACSSKRVTTT